MEPVWNTENDSLMRPILLTDTVARVIRFTVVTTAKVNKSNDKCMARLIWFIKYYCYEENFTMRQYTVPK